MKNKEYNSNFYLFINIMSIIKKFDFLDKVSSKSANILFSSVISGIFLGLSRNEDDIIRSIFVIPCVSYLYSCVIIKRPYILVIYLLSFYIAKKINEKFDGRKYN